MAGIPLGKHWMFIPIVKLFHRNFDGSHSWIKLHLFISSFLSTGFAPLKILACCNSFATAFTGSFTVRGKSFSLGRWDASSEKCGV